MVQRYKKMRKVASEKCDLPERAYRVLSHDQDCQEVECAEDLRCTMAALVTKSTLLLNDFKKNI